MRKLMGEDFNPDPERWERDGDPEEPDIPGYRHSWTGRPGTEQEGMHMTLTLSFEDEEEKLTPAVIAAANAELRGVGGERKIPRIDRSTLGNA